MQITKAEYNKELLTKWQHEIITEKSISEALAEHIKRFGENLNNVTREKNFGVYIKGLLSNLKRKSMEPIALEYMGENGVRSLQQFITRSNFDDEKMVEAYQSQLAVTINSANGMLSVDGSDFVKKGKKSVGVKRQYCGRLGKVESCQAGVFVAYAGDNGYGLVDRELYLPKEWLDDEHAELRKKCQVPEDKVFKTKNEIALEMIAETIEKAKFSVKWIGCDAAFGCDHDFVDSLPKTALYFVATNKKERVFLPGSDKPVEVKTLADNKEFIWHKVGFQTSKGVINSDIKAIRCFSCRTDDKNTPCKSGAVWLYIRRYSDGTTKFFLTNAPDDISLDELHEAATLRWPIEQCFEECKSHLGMADFEGRSYKGFLRHLLFVMIAHFFSTNLRLTLKKTVSQ